MKNHTLRPRYWVRALAGLTAVFLGACAGGQRPDSTAPSVPGDGTYYVYVAAESSDLLHRVRFGPDGAQVDRTIPVGEMPNENEGPHGLRMSPDGDFVFMTTGHGVPDGKLWKIDAGPDTLALAPVLLGYFPATLDVTPDGLYAFVANFNLHGEMVPSTISVVFTPDMIEVDQIETCVMPHGARLDQQGEFLFSACMMDDQLVEVDTRTFQVSRRFSVAVGKEGPLEVQAGTHESAHGPPSCSPTWALPTADGRFVYVACNRAGHILEIDRLSWSVNRVFEAGMGPYNLALDPEGELLVATLKSGAGVQFFDLATGQSSAVTPTSTTIPHGVVISPDGRYAFVSVEGVGAEPGKVDIYDLDTFKRIADVEVGQQAGGIAFWRIER